VWGLDALERYDADAIRYYLTNAMPEQRDTDWDWEEFFQRNNNELVATWGNLVNRVLSFTYKNFDGRIPNPGQLRETDEELLKVIRAGFESVAGKLEQVELKAGLAEVMALAAEVNKYLDVHAPWFEIKTDRDQAAKSLYTAIQAIEWIKIMSAPFLPNTSETLHQLLAHGEPLFGKQFSRFEQDALGEHEILGLETSGTQGQDVWVPLELEAGREVNQPVPLIKKLDHKIVEEERARLGKPSE
jgi:methionyl-tRNA synthetase